MIQIPIDPTVTVIGPFTLTWHGLSAGFGLLTGIAIVIQRAHKSRIPSTLILNALLWAIPAGLVGARLLHVAESWPYYSQRPWLIPAITESGMASYGEVIAGGFAAWWYLRRRLKSVCLVADSAGIGLLAGHGVSLIGTVISGENSGVPSYSTWGVIYTHPESLAETNVVIHPAGGYEMVWAFIIAGLLWRWANSGSPGATFWACIVLYSVGRLGAGFFRLEAALWLTLSHTQLLASAGMVTGLTFLLWLWVTGRPGSPRRASSDK